MSDPGPVWDYDNERGSIMKFSAETNEGVAMRQATLIDVWIIWPNNARPSGDNMSWALVSRSFKSGAEHYIPAEAAPATADATELKKALGDLFAWCEDTVPYFGENRRGSRADEVYRRTAKALGEKLTDLPESP